MRRLIVFVDIIFISKNHKFDKNKFMKDFNGKIYFRDNRLKCDEFIFNYEFKKSINDSIIRLKVSTIKGTSTHNEAKALCYLKDRIRQGEHRKDYNIIIDYDGSSEYYCNRLSPLISRFERKLRQCIYLIMLAAYGNEWVHKTIFANVLKEVTRKENNKNRHVEMALECFTFNNYIEYLFNTREEFNSVKIIEEAKFEANKSESEKKDVLSILNKYKVVSLWEKLFDIYDDIEFLEKDLNDLKNKRNNVLHHKEMSDSDFIDYKKVFMENNKKLDCAIRRIEDEKYKVTANVIDVFYAYSETIKTVLIENGGAISFVKPAMEDLIKINSGLSALVKVQEEAINLSLGMKSKLADLVTPAYNAYLGSISQLQNSVKTNFSSIVYNYNKSMEPIYKLATTMVPEGTRTRLKLIQDSINLSCPDNIKNLFEAIENSQILNNKFDEINKSSEDISEEEDK